MSDAPRAPRRALPFDLAAEAEKAKNKPTVFVDPGALDEVVTAAEDALIDTGQQIYQQGRLLVRPVVMKVGASNGRDTLAPALEAFNPDSLMDYLARAAHWVKRDGRRNAPVPCSPPRQIATMLLSRVGEWRFPSISGIVTAPTMRADGTILTKPGYDKRTKLYHMVDDSLQIPRVFEHPTRADAEKALRLLGDLLAGFPFKHQVDYSVGLSAVMTPFVRGACPVTPLHACSSHEAGSGKSHFMDTVSSILTGRWCPVVAQSIRPEETEKQLTGLLLAGQPIISIDNVVQELSSALLCQAVERPLVQVRPLGTSGMMLIENRCTFFATGNNLVIAGDMARRAMLCELDAGMERPETRTFDFDPVARVMQDRGKYIAAVLTIIRAYQACGRRVEVTPFQGFDAWSRYVREALVWLGCEDPVRSVDMIRSGDPERMQMRALLSTWEAAFGDDRMTAANAIAVVQEGLAGRTDNGPLIDLRDAMMAVAAERGGTISSRRLGKWLSKHKGRILDNMQINSGGSTKNGMARWYVHKTDGSPPTRQRTDRTQREYHDRVADLDAARRARRSREGAP